MFYVLDKDGNAKAATRTEFGRVGEKTLRGSDMRNEGKGLVVSTVFLGVKHGFEYGKPVLWETMVFKLKKNGKPDYRELECKRYTSLQDARAGHAEMVEKYVG